PRYVPESEFESESPSNQPGIVTDNRLTSVEDLDSAGARNALIESLKLTVRISHATIASMTGVPVRQDATTAVFDGPPTALSVRFGPDAWEWQAMEAGKPPNPEPIFREELFGVEVYIQLGIALGVLTLLVPWLLLAGYARRSRAVLAAPI